MIQIILIGLTVVIVVLVVIVATKPSEFVVARSLNIGGPPEAVFGQVNDLHHFQEWSPWAKLDPQCKTTFEGPPAGQGASFTWDGNNKVGAGRMTLTESRPNELIRFRLDFARPFKGTNMAEFTFKPEGGQTAVRWSMSGRYNVIMKVMSLFMNCDKMIGQGFEKGLAQLDSLVRSGGAEVAKT